MINIGDLDKRYVIKSWFSMCINNMQIEKVKEELEEIINDVVEEVECDIEQKYYY